MAEDETPDPSESSRERRGALRGPRAIVLGMVAILAAGTIYRWVDERGQVHYSDSPPVQGESQEIEPPPPPSAVEQQESAARAAEIEQVVSERRHERQEAAAAERDAQQRADAAAAEAKQHCIQALEQQITLSMAVPVYRREIDGSRRFITDAERDTERARLETIVARDCSSAADAQRDNVEAALVLHRGRSPGCVDLRNEIAGLETGGNPTRLEAARAELLAKCPDVPIEGVWLAQRIVIRR